MGDSGSKDPTRQGQLGFWLYYLLFGAMVVRALVFSLSQGRFPPLPYALMGCFLLLSLIEPWLRKRSRIVVEAWLGTQALVIFAMLLTRPEHDYYAMLYMALSFPVSRSLSAAAWSGSGSSASCSSVGSSWLSACRMGSRMRRRSSPG